MGDNTSSWRRGMLGKFRTWILVCVLIFVFYTLIRTTLEAAEYSGTVSNNNNKQNKGTLLLLVVILNGPRGCYNPYYIVQIAKQYHVVSDNINIKNIC